MALTVGRAGRTLTLPEPSRWDVQNGQVMLEGMFQTSPVTDAMRLRDQLLGYHDNLDEPIIPVVVASEPRLTGYYRVLSVNITTDVEALNSGYLGYQIALQAVWGYTQPMLESIIASAQLTTAVSNGSTAANWRTFHAFPAVANEYSLTPWPGGPPGFRTRASETGSLELVSQIPGVAGTAIARWSLAPANYYIGAVDIEQGSALQPLVGRQLTQPDLVNWRLSNGLIRIAPNASPGKLDVQAYNGSVWSTVKTWDINGTTVHGVCNGLSTLTVLRNSPEQVIVRLGLKFTNGAYLVSTGYIGEICNLDLSIRRGDRFIRAYLTGTIADAWKVVRDTAETGVAWTPAYVTGGGIRANANDSDGNRYLLLSYQAATTLDTVNGGLTLTATGTTMDFGIGIEIAGSASVDPDTADMMTRNYLAASDESQRIVAR